MSDDMRCTFEGMSDSCYVVQVDHDHKRTILTVCKSLDEARHYIKLKYRGAIRTVPTPRELSLLKAVEKYRYTFQRTKWNNYESLYILITRQIV